MTTVADRERDRRSLKDLAKMASGLTPAPSSVSPSGVQRAAEAKKEDSGMVDLAAASQADVGAAARAQRTPLASQGLFEDQPHQPPPSIPPMSGVPGSVPPSGHYHATPSAPPAAYYGQGPASVHPIAGQLNKKKSGGATIAIVMGGLIAFSAAAAGSFMYLRTHKLGRDATALAPATTAVTTPAEAQPNPTPAPTTTAGEREQQTTPSELSSDSNAVAHTTAPAKGSAGKTAAAKPSAKTPVHEPAAKAEASKPEAVAAEPAIPPPSPTMPGDLGAAIKKEIGDEPAKVPAAGATGGSSATGNVPQKPSQGAVTGALGAVLPQARGCLGPDDPISRASVVFTSSGAIQSISVSGGAAGKPAESCIKDALGKAKLQPFAEPTYTANITIRHN